MNLYMPVRVFCQERCVHSHGRELRALGKKAMIVTGRNSARVCGALDDILEALGDTPSILFDRVEENPSTETVMEARNLAISQGADFFIGIGGGSPMDAAKAIAMMAANPGDDASVFYAPGEKAHFPVVCVPTTCGTGSEVTPYAILTRHAQQTKKSISHRIWPALALLDPKYIRALPRHILVNTAVDALAHALESRLNTNANSLNRLYSREALLLWGQVRDRLLADRLEDGDYETLLLASMAAGCAISHTGTSLPHGLSYTLTYDLGIPHGRAAGVFLGGYVCAYGDPRAAEEAVSLLGFRQPQALKDYLAALLGPTQVPEETLRRAADVLLADPGKVKNYPFPTTRELLLSIKE